MSKKERKLRTIMLPVPGGLVPHIGRFTDDELEDDQARDPAAALFQRAVAGKLSERAIGRNRFALLLQAVKADRVDMLTRFVPEKKRLTVEQVMELSDAAAGSPDAAAWLLQYRRAHYTAQDLEDYETHRMDLELGFSEPSVAELRKVLRLNYTAGGVCVSGFKTAQTEIVIPARIGEKDVIGVDAAAFYALKAGVRVRRVFLESAALPELRGLKPGDVITLGRAMQDKKAPEQSLKWRVLSIEDGRVLVLAESAVALAPFHPELEDVTWETCALRRWLNTVFLPLSFTAKERTLLLPAAVTTPDNAQFASSGGAETEDVLFVLSADEANRYLPTDEARRLGRWWWLRTPGFDNTFAQTVTPDGSIVRVGTFVDSEDYAVRPAMWLRA